MRDATGRDLPLRVRALVWVRWPRTGRLLAVPEPAIAAEIHQPLDIELHLAAQVAFDEKILVDHLADLQHFVVGELVDAPVFRDVDLLHELLGPVRADAVDILQRHDDALVRGDIYACNSCHDLFSKRADRPALRSRALARLTLTCSPQGASERAK